MVVASQAEEPLGVPSAGKFWLLIGQRTGAGAQLLYLGSQSEVVVTLCGRNIPQEILLDISFFNIQLFVCFITQFVKKLRERSFYEVIETILPFVLNTNRSLSDIW